MDATTHNTQPSFAETIYALILAIAAFLDVLVAKATSDGQPLPPSLRALAKSVQALRALYNLAGYPGTTPPAFSPPEPAARPELAARPAAHPPARPPARPATASAPRRLTPRPTKAAPAWYTSRYGIPREPSRTLEL